LRTERALFLSYRERRAKDEGELIFLAGENQRVLNPLPSSQLRLDREESNEKE
jgi:hypothetical protein